MKVFMLNTEIRPPSLSNKMQQYKRLAIHLKCITGLKRITYIKSSVNCDEIKIGIYFHLRVLNMGILAHIDNKNP